MEIDGRCHCGAVTYRARIDPGRVTICHCTDCQALTGSPFRLSVTAERGDLTIEGEALRDYAKRAQNGVVRHQLFCGTCGSPVFTHGEGGEREPWGIRWGTIRQRRELRPTRQIWCRSAVDFLDDISAVPGFATEPTKD